MKQFDPDPARQAEIEALMAQRPPKTIPVQVDPETGRAMLMIPGAAARIAKHAVKPHLLKP